MGRYLLFIMNEINKSSRKNIYFQNMNKYIPIDEVKELSPEAIKGKTGGANSSVLQLSAVYSGATVPMRFFFFFKYTLFPEKKKNTNKIKQQ